VTSAARAALVTASMPKLQSRSEARGWIKLRDGALGGESACFLLRKAKSPSAASSASVASPGAIPPSPAQGPEPPRSTFKLRPVREPGGLPGLRWPPLGLAWGRLASLGAVGLPPLPTGRVSRGIAKRSGCHWGTSGQLQVEGGGSSESAHDVAGLVGARAA
jgi:hypothetical protein